MHCTFIMLYMINYFAGKNSFFPCFRLGLGYDNFGGRVFNWRLEYIIVRTLKYSQSHLAKLFTKRTESSQIGQSLRLFWRVQTIYFVMWENTSRQFPNETVWPRKLLPTNMTKSYNQYIEYVFQILFDNFDKTMEFNRFLSIL